MNSINVLSWLLAIFPIILVLLLMVVFKWGGSKAGMLTWLVAQVVALAFFGASIEILQYSLIKAFFISIDILLIIWGALFLYQVTKRAGTIDVIGKFLSDLTENKAFVGIFLGWLFPSFLQGMGGFGVPVAVSAPLLVSAGFSPIMSVVMTSIGHGWGVTFGSMGSSFRTLMGVTGLSAEYLSPLTAVLLGISSFFCGFFVVYLAGGKKHFKKAIPLTLISSFILFIGQYYLATNGLWVIAVTLPAMVSLGVSFLYVRYFSSYSRNFLTAMDKKERNRVLTSFLPYLILVLMIVIFNFFQPLKDFFNPFAFSLKFPELSTSQGFVTPAEASKKINLFIHPGTIIGISSLISYIFLKKNNYLNGGELSSIIKDSFKSSRNTSIAILSLVGTAVVMNHAQMTNIIASGISTVISPEIFPVFSPFIGALGAFITGSNNNSNVLFGNLQMQTALLMDLPVALILAAQTVGGALGSIMAPAKVILGCSTVGLSGKEGQVIGKLILYTSILILSMGIITYLILKIF